jgi:hypothetical protein
VIVAKMMVLKVVAVDTDVNVNKANALIPQALRAYNTKLVFGSHEV